MNDEKQRFLDHVAAIHGPVLRDACERILKQDEHGGKSEFIPLAVLRQAQQETCGDQLRAASAAEDRCFDSDGDL